MDVDNQPDASDSDASEPECYDRRHSCPEEVGPVGSEPGPARRGTSQLDRTQANRATSGPAGAGP
jgi:hypothetical protein